MATTNAVPSFKRPKDDMKSTWRQKPWKDMTYHQRVIAGRGMYHQTIGKEPPVHAKTDPLPVIPEWHIHRWILWHAAVPLAVHQSIIWYCGGVEGVHPTVVKFAPLIVIVGYSLALLATGIHQFNMMRWMGEKYGFLDGEKKRDDVPDHSVRKTVVSLLTVVFSRMTMAVFLTYKPLQAPIQMDWLLLPVVLGLYGVVLDFWFYWYHRVMHHSEKLWTFHRTHHLTKHPTALLTEYADEEQEFLDMIGIPFLTYVSLFAMGIRMDFYTWWILTNYLVYTELVGHSGLRIHTGTASTVNWLLRYFECELVIEDHDLHHRQGWKKSCNYGKQTRLWDRIFGTVGNRIESVPQNVDWVNTATLPAIYLSAADRAKGSEAMKKIS